MSVIYGRAVARTTRSDCVQPFIKGHNDLLDISFVVSVCHPLVEEVASVHPYSFGENETMEEFVAFSVRCRGASVVCYVMIRKIDLELTPALL